MKAFVCIVTGLKEEGGWDRVGLTSAVTNLLIEHITDYIVDGVSKG